MSLPLLDHLRQVPDHRHHNRQHPLSSVLALSVCAMLCGARSLYAIGQWGRDQGEPVANALGFAKGRTPCVSTLHYVFKKLDVVSFEGALQRWVAEARDVTGRAASMDGKRLCGIHGEQIPGVALLSLFSHKLGLTLAQQPIGAQGELVSARQLLAALDLHGLILTGDALYCQRDICDQIVKKGATT